MGAYDDLIPGAGPSRRPSAYDDLLPGGAPAATGQPAEVAAPVGAVDTPSPGIFAQARDFVSRAMPNQQSLRFPFGRGEGVATALEGRPRSVIAGVEPGTPAPQPPEIGPASPGFIPQGGVSELELAKALPKIGLNTYLKGAAGLARIVGELQDEAGIPGAEKLAGAATRIARERGEAIGRLQAGLTTVAPSKGEIGSTAPELAAARVPERFGRFFGSQENIGAMAQQGPQLAGVAASLAGAPMAATLAATLALPVLGQTFHDYREQGYELPAALLGAVGQSATETIPEAWWIKFTRQYKLGDVVRGISKMAPADRAAAVGGLLKGYGVVAGSELFNELTSTTGNDAVSYLMKEPDMTWEKFGQDLAQTVQQIGPMLPIMGGVAHAGRMLGQRALETPSGRSTVLADELRRAVDGTDLPRTEVSPLAPTTEPTVAAQQRPPIEGVVTGRQVEPAPAEPAVPSVLAGQAAAVPPAVTTQPAPEPAPTGPMVPPEQAFQRLVEAHPDAGLTMVAPDDVPADQRRTAELLTKALDKRVIFVSGNPKIYEGSMFTDAPHTFYVNVNSERAWRSVIGHETLHTLRQTNPAVYDELQRAVLQVVSTGPAAQRYNEKYGVTPATRQEEMLADMHGDFMDDPKFWVEVFRASKRPLVQRIYDSVRQVYDSLYQRLTRGGTKYKATQLVTDLDAARKAFAKAYVDWQAQPHAPVPGGITAADMARMEPGAPPAAAHMHAQPGARIPITTDIIDTIDNEVVRLGGAKTRVGTADVAAALGEHHKQELLRMMDTVGADKRPTIMLHKGDLASGTPTVWLLGWSTKEGTDIHDHAGSNVGVHVLRGSVRERVYGVRGNKVARLEARNNPAGVDALQSERDLRAGSTLALGDPYIHEVFGHSENMGERDVTVHAYFPPLTKMTYFTYDAASGKLKYDGEWDEAKPPNEADKLRKSLPGLRDFTPNVHGITAGPAVRGLTPEQSRVQRAIARPQGVGAPVNPRTVLRDQKGELVVGQIRKGDWLKRAREMLPGDEFKRARHWYERLDSVLRPVFGEKTSNVALAWMLSQQRASPSQGMMNVMRAFDRLSGLPGPKAGLNEQAIIQALREGNVAGGMGAKLADFLDSHTGAATRTVMGGDVRGGQPAAIDVHAYQDVGFVDKAFLRAIADRFGEDAAAKLTEDLTQGDETSYEHASRFYNDLVKYLNDAKVDGGGWTAREAQAVGWASIQKSIGLTPQMPEDIIGKNVRRVSVGLEPGAGVTGPRMRAPVAENLVRDLAGLTGVKILGVEHGQGAYLGQQEGAVQVDALASPEAVLDYITAIGYAAKQSSVIATRALKSGAQMGYDIPSPELTDAGVAQEFFAALHAIPGMTDIAPGYQQTAQGLRLLNFAGHWNAKQIAALDAAVAAAAEKTGVPIGELVHFHVNLVESTNDWQAQTQGQTYLKSLRDRGRDALAGQLERQYGPTSAAGTQAAAAARLSQPGERVSPLEGSPQYKAAQQAAEKYFSDYAAARTAYEALPETEHGRILNPDLASELVAEYRAARELATAVHDSASNFVKAYYADKLKETTPAERDERVIFTAGGPGSGKSTAVRAATGESASRAEMYYDSMLSRFDSAKSRIDAALESGRAVQVIFVDRAPGLAYEGTIQRVLAGYRRIVPIGEHARGHVEARKTFKKLQATYANDDRVNLLAIDNNDGLDAIKPIASNEIGPWEYTAAYEAALRIAAEANAQGFLSDAQVYAATGRTAAEVRSLVGSRAVGGAAQERGTGRASSPGPRPAASAAAGSQRPATNWNVEQPGVVDNLARSLQDNVIDLKRIQDAIREAGGVIQALNDPYLTEELAKARYADRIKRFDNKLVAPLLQDLKKKGITASELDQYLWARHAPEANAALAKINPGLRNPSGMSDAEASKIIADFRSKGVLPALTALAARVDAITAATRKLYVDEKLQSQKTIDVWESTYQHYVPLQREIANPEPGVGQGFKIRGPESKRRMGSERPVTAILAAVIAKHHTTIIRAEKAHVGRDLIKLAEEFKNPDFWSVDTPPLQRYVNLSSGLVEMRIDPMYKNREDVFVVKDADANGDIVERVLAFNPHNERALALSRAMQKLDVVEQQALTRVVGTATRYIANLATQWNPVFWATNLARDVGTMAINLQSTPLKGMAPRVMSRMPGAIAGIASATWGNGTGRYANLWREASEEGMPTGWYKNFENILERQKELEKMIKQAGQNAADPRVWARWSAQQISNVNSMIENSTRLAVYSVARDQGLSKREAASIAKNITVNFDRKGNSSAAAGAWFMFFNANVQGGVRLARGLNESPRARAMVGLMAAMGAAMEIINMLIGDHDKDEAGNNPYEILGPYEKQRNWIFMVPKSWGLGDEIKDEKQQVVGRYFKFPLPYGFNIFPTAGRIAAEAVMSRVRPGLYSEKRGPLDLAADFGNVVVDAFSPLGSASTAIQTIAPTLADPFIQVWENKKWTGTPMVPDRSMQKALPRSSLYFTNNSESAKDLAAWLNRATGGDELTPGWMDVYPGHIEHVFRTLTGGPGTFAMGMFDWGQNITQRALGHEVEPVKTSSIPFVGKFYGEVDERAIEAKFYRIKGQADETYARYRAYRKAGDIDAADKLEEQQPALIEFARAIAKSQFRKDQKELREEVKATREKPIIDRAAAKLEIKRDQSRLYREALEAYNATASEGR